MTTSAFNHPSRRLARLTELRAELAAMVSRNAPDDGRTLAIAIAIVGLQADHVAELTRELEILRAGPSLADIPAELMSKA